MKSNRRQFIKQCMLLYGSVLFLPSCRPSAAPVWYSGFTAQEASAIDAICEQLIPADDYPGAREAGVIHYIDKLLYQRFPQHKQTYRQGLAGVEACSQALYGNSFAELTGAQQIAMLELMERGELPARYWPQTTQKAFFELILAHTMQGFYGSPRHGGNKDYVSYRMMKLDYPLLIGQNRYEK